MNRSSFPCAPGGKWSTLAINSVPPSTSSRVPRPGTGRKGSFFESPKQGYEQLLRVAAIHHREQSADAAARLVQESSYLLLAGAALSGHEHVGFPLGYFLEHVKHLATEATLA